MANEDFAVMYKGLDQLTIKALSLGRDELETGNSTFLTVHGNNEQMISAMADRLLEDYQNVLKAGRKHCVMIVPVGPVGQYDLLAERCIAENISLASLTLIIMDEYLTESGDWIDEDNPLSFRGHLKKHLTDQLPAALAPCAIVVPDPRNLEFIAKIIDENDGVDVCYAGVGITGHLAFNDPEYGRSDADWFANLSTRIVRLLPETRLINSVTAAGGNTQLIPFQAVTVGMKEILGARKLRIWMNRDWQRAAIRRMLHGPITAEYPASLIQRHQDISLDVVEGVLQMPEPGLK